MSMPSPFRTVLAGIRPPFWPDTRLKRLIVAGVAAGLSAMGQAAVLQLPPAFEITSCGTPSELTRGGFPCGAPALGPGLGEIPGVGLFEQRAVVEFSLAHIQGPEQAMLALMAAGRSAYPTLQSTPIIEVRGFPGDGLPSQDDLSSGDLLFSAAFQFNGRYSFDVTPFVAAATRQGWAYVGFGLRDVAFGSDVTFHGGNALVITVPGVPEPSAALLALAGLGACALQGLAVRKRIAAQPHPVI